MSFVTLQEYVENTTLHTHVICVQTPTQAVLKAQELFFVVFFLAFLGIQVENDYHLCFLITFGTASMLVLVADVGSGEVCYLWTCVFTSGSVSTPGMLTCFSAPELDTPGFFMSLQLEGPSRSPPGQV